MEFHAIIIYGGNKDDRMSKAKEMLKAHFINDPFASEKIEEGTFEDLLVIQSDEGKVDITVDKIRTLTENFALKPFASVGRAAIIVDGEMMNEFAQNKLLKVLEEPAVNNVIYILTTNPEKLLPTIRSRCVTKWIGYENEVDNSEVIDDVKEVVRILLFGKGTLAEAFYNFSTYEKDRERAESFMCAMMMFIRDLTVGSFEPSIVSNEDVLVAASKVNSKLALLMQKDIIIIENALGKLKRGFSVKNTLRDMALCMKQEAINA